MGWALPKLIHLNFTTPRRQVLLVPCPTGQETGLQSHCPGNWGSNTGPPDSQMWLLQLSVITGERGERDLEERDGRAWRYTW